jgi:hypothetical protein
MAQPAMSPSIRADHPDTERLQRAKDWLKGKNGGALVPIGDLLVTGRDAFLALCLCLCLCCRLTSLYCRL